MSKKGSRQLKHSNIPLISPTAGPSPRFSGEQPDVEYTFASGFGIVLESRPKYVHTAESPCFFAFQNTYLSYLIPAQQMRYLPLFLI